MTKGEMLIELMIALAIAMLTLVAIINATTKSVSTSTFSKRQSEATTYVTKAMDWVRQQKNSDWLAFSSKSSGGAGSTYCLNSLTTLSSMPSGNCGAGVIPTTIFTRYATFSNLGSNQIQVQINVTWPESNKSFSTKQTVVFIKY